MIVVLVYLMLILAAPLALPPADPDTEARTSSIVETMGSNA